MPISYSSILGGKPGLLGRSITIFDDTSKALDSIGSQLWRSTFLKKQVYLAAASLCSPPAKEVTFPNTSVRCYFPAGHRGPVDYYIKMLSKDGKIPPSKRQTFPGPNFSLRDAVSTNLILSPTF